MIDLILAFAAGLLTLLNPCVLPLLPMIAAGAVARHALGPLAMAAGMAVSFTLAGMGAFALTRATGLAQEDITMAAGWVMLGFGLVQLIPQAQARFGRLAGAAAGGGTRLIGQVENRGLAGEALGGALLGLAWSPCIGPTLGAAIGLAAQGDNLGFAFGVMAMFSAGAATIMLALAYGTRSLIASRKALLARITPHAKTILGVGLIVVGLAIIFRFDRLVEGWALAVLPGWFTDISVSI
ncbi:cytochrome c biogenesis CcdA family protein [Devosia psychrophila]|uniref:Cytochrome c biogenesis protein CcdA n=1 Tax=Devosia psychrophila TaxID=728005 RepID=A0A1I1QHT2_9HYPH|nr:cytochrome c biogenesis CcdA family protein [Devosia psychrophila]SFD21714.1 Cytochrome c biogenesis protein CcdA [Devosia psychrophila]